MDFNLNNMEQKQGVIEGTPERLNKLMTEVELNLEVKVSKGKLMFRIRDKVADGHMTKIAIIC